MRSLFLILMILSVAVGAEAQGVINTLQCTVQAKRETELPGANCPYGGEKYTCQPALSPAVVSYFCYPGNTGAAGSNGVSVTGFSEAPGANCPYGGTRLVASNGTFYACNGAPGAAGSNGAPGAQGPAGEDGIDATEMVYFDKYGYEVEGIHAIDAQPYLLVDNHFALMDPETGTAASELCDNAPSVLYDNATCAGNPFYYPQLWGQVFCAKNKTGQQRYWVDDESIGVQGTCYGYVQGHGCQQLACPGNDAFSVHMVTVAAPEGAELPWRMGIRQPQ